MRPWRRYQTCYGYRPVTAIGTGLLLAAFSGPFWPFTYAFARTAGDGWPRLELSAIAGAVLALLVLVVLPGALLLLGLGAVARGAADLLTGRRTVQGQVLHVSRYRYRAGGGKGLVMWWVIVDDGGPTVRPWALLHPPTFAEGAVVRARVTRHLAHVKDLEVLRAT